MQFIPHPTRLDGSLVTLLPLAPEHIPVLLRIGADPSIWDHLPLNGESHALHEAELRNALLLRAQGAQYPFTVVERRGGSIIGNTRLFDLFPEHKKLEIGWTWYAPEFWGKGFNTEAKLLLLGFCFEVMNLNRVQLKTRAANLRSRAAIEKIGGVFEGTLRQDRVWRDGTARDTVVYSIIKEEWAGVKEMLSARVGEFAGH